MNERKKNLDYDRLFEVCKIEGICPILYKELRNEEGIPEEFLKKLKGEYIWNKIKNTVFLQEIEKLKALNKPILLLKGSALIMSVYDDIALRPMSDIDIMVQEEDLECIHKFLIENGYRLISMEYNTFDRRLGAGRKYVKDFLCFDVSTHIEVLYIGKKADKKAFMNSNRLRDNLFILCPEDLLLHILIHMSNHHFFYRLIWLYDIKMILEKFNINWKCLFERIKKINLNSLILFGLFEAKRIFKLKIPGLSEYALKEPSRKILSIENAVFLLTIPGIRNKLLFLSSSLFPSSDYLRLRYGKDSLFYRIIRPFHVISKLLIKLIKHERSNYNS